MFRTPKTNSFPARDVKREFLPEVLNNRPALASSGRQVGILLGILFLMGFCKPASVAGFGPTGHRAIGKVAQRYLTPEGNQLVARILGDETLPEVSTWADEIRSDPAWKHAAAWHYVDIEDEETYASSQKNPDGDMIEAIQRFVTVLRDPNADAQEQAVALKWLVHLMGDVHQPLHVGRKENKGGNTIQSRWFDERTNLHAIWDDKMIDSTKLSYTELAEFLRPKDQAELKSWQDSEIEDWVRESYELRERAYSLPKQTTSGSYAFSYENLPVVKLRLTQAGVRLAALLNKIAAARVKAGQ